MIATLTCLPGVVDMHLLMRMQYLQRMTTCREGWCQCKQGCLAPVIGLEVLCTMTTNTGQYNLQQTTAPEAKTVLLGYCLLMASHCKSIKAIPATSIQPPW